MVIKVIEIMASSEKSWEDAAQNAVNEASKSIRGIKSVYMNEMSATVVDGKMANFRANCKISFEVK
ncbi:dodecin family protein [Persicitalea sp.]|uniref:dodecin family protein n=1 Tax=Persicitalea sp. TaxID=3100273 RepID=UPI0035932D42